MARFEKYSGTQGLPGVRRPQAIADTAVGNATVALGGQIQRSAGQIGRLAEVAQRRQQKIDTFEQIKAQHKLQAYVKDRQAEELQNLRPGAVGYTEAMLAHLEKGREDALKDLPESVHVAFNREIEARRAEYADRFAAQEHAESRRYFQQGFSDVSEGLVAGVHENPDRLEDIRREGVAVLDAMPLAQRSKEEALQGLNEKLAEAWIETRPVKDQISALESELRRREAAQLPAEAGGPVSEGVSPETVPGATRAAAQTADVPGSDIAAGHLAVLPDIALKRLHENAVKKRTVGVTAEADRIAGRITDAHGLFDAREIEYNPLLEPHQKLQLISGLNHAMEEQRKNIEAVNWVLSPASPAPGDRDLAERAFVYLDDGETDRDALARGMLRTKGVVPQSYVRGLRAGLESSDPEEVGKAYDTLSHLFLVSRAFARQEEPDNGLLETEAKWHLLTDLHGLTPDKAAARLAQANDPAQRKILERELEGRETGNGWEQIDADGVLNRLGASGQSIGQIPIDDLLSGIDFIDRGRRDGSGNDIEIAGGAEGLRGPAGVIAPGQLDPDAPSGFYGGLTPNQAGHAALPYIRMMSDLMNPASTASVLFNRKGGSPGGRKAADSGKNEQHGDGGRANEKTQKQIQDLNARLAEAKTRREKEKLKGKIQKIIAAGHRAKKGENHSKRGK